MFGSDHGEFFVIIVHMSVIFDAVLDAVGSFQNIVDGMSSLQISVRTSHWTLSISSALIRFGHAVCMECSNEGVTLTCISNDCTVFLSSRMPSSLFSRLQSQRPVKFAVDLFHLRAVLKSASRKASCMVKLSGDIRALEMVFIEECMWFFVLIYLGC